MFRKISRKLDINEWFVIVESGDILNSKDCFCGRQLRRFLNEKLAMFVQVN